MHDDHDVNEAKGASIS